MRTQRLLLGSFAFARPACGAGGIGGSGGGKEGGGIVGGGVMGALPVPFTDMDELNISLLEVGVTGTDFARCRRAI